MPFPHNREKGTTLQSNRHNADKSSAGGIKPLSVTPAVLGWTARILYRTIAVLSIDILKKVIFFQFTFLVLRVES